MVVLYKKGTAKRKFACSVITLPNAALPKANVDGPVGQACIFRWQVSIHLNPAFGGCKGNHVRKSHNQGDMGSMFEFLDLNWEKDPDLFDHSSQEAGCKVGISGLLCGCRVGPWLPFRRSFKQRFVSKHVQTFQEVLGCFLIHPLYLLFFAQIHPASQVFGLLRSLWSEATPMFNTWVWVQNRYPEWDPGKWNTTTKTCRPLVIQF